MPVRLKDFSNTTVCRALGGYSGVAGETRQRVQQAAQIDGCSRLAVIYRVTIPLAVPALVSVAIYTFMIAWNEFLYALVFLNDRHMFTMPIKINTIYNDPSPRPHVVMAASAIMSLPVMFLFLSLERFLEEGLSAGGVKG